MNYKLINNMNYKFKKEISPWKYFKSIVDNNTIKETISDEHIPYKKYKFQYIMGTMPELYSFMSKNKCLIIIDSIFRSLGLFCFISNPLLGLFVLFGIIITGWWPAICVILNLIITNTFGLFFFKLDKEIIQKGLIGYNSVYISLAFSFLYDIPWEIDYISNDNIYYYNNFYIIILSSLFSIISIILLLALGQIFVNKLNVSVGFLPALLITLLLPYITSDLELFGVVKINTVTRNVTNISNFNIIETTKLLLRGPSQLVFCQDYQPSGPDLCLYASIPIYFGLLITSPIGFLMSLFGILFGTLFSLMLNLHNNELYSGLQILNSIGVSMFLGGLYFVITFKQVVLTILAIFLNIFLYKALANIFPAQMTLSSFLVVLIFQLTPFPSKQIIPIELSSVTFPLDHLKRYSLSKFILSKFGIIKSIASYKEVLPKSNNEMKLIEKTLLPIMICNYIVENKYVEIKKLINLGANINLQDYYGRTPLHIASSNNNFELVKLLVENGAKTDILDNLHHNCLFDSFYFNNFEVSDYLFKQNAKLIGNTTELFIIFEELLLGKKIKKIKKFIKYIYDVNVLDDSNKNLLHYVGIHKNIEIAQTLIDKKINYDVIDNNNICAKDYFKNILNFNYKIDNNSIKINSNNFNIEYGDIGETKYKNIVDKSIIQAVLFSIIKKNTEQIKDIFIGAMLCVCGAQNDIGSIKFLLQNNINICQNDHDGANILHLASANNSLNLLKYILIRINNYDFINKKDRWGNTPLHEACINNNSNIVNLLLQYDCKLLLDEFQINKIFNSLLKYNKLSKIKLFLKSGLDIKKLNKKNRLLYNKIEL